MTPASVPVASVLIPAYNEERFVGTAVASVRQAFAECGAGAPEIIVCDNASTDATARVAMAAGATVVHEAHRQIARSRNAAARASSRPWLIWLDADSEMTPSLLRATLATMQEGRCCGGGAQVRLVGPGLTWSPRFVLWAWNTAARLGKLAAGSYFFARRDGWEAVGGFDEAVYAGEELGFARRLKAWGRERGLGFAWLAEPVLSSTRKLVDHTPWQTVRQILPLVLPGRLARREDCRYWYERRDAPPP